MKDYGLIATANQINLAKIVEKYGKEGARKWVESLTEDELYNLQADPYFNLRVKQVIDWRGDYFGAFALPGRNFGKAESYLTDIYGVFDKKVGWKKFGELKVGDKVFDEYGKTCNVTAIYPQPPVQAYRIHFTDHTYTDVGSEHLWRCWSNRSRKQFMRSDNGQPDNGEFPPKDWASWTKEVRKGNGGQGFDLFGCEKVTTQHIIDNFTVGKRGDSNWSIPLAQPLELPEVELPIEPYLAGLHIGDGGTNTATLSTSDDDAPYYRQAIIDAGYPIGVYRCVKGRSWLISGIEGMSRDIKEHLKDKEIPEIYLRGSIEQRFNFLCGLMDSDGWAGKSTIEFCSMRKDHADVVIELARSLGQKPTLCTGKAMLKGKDYGTKYRVFWKPTCPELIPFKIPRKRDKVEFKFKRNQGAIRQRMMCSYEDLGIQSGYSCISVDSPNNLYLTGKGLIPTSNTYMGSQFCSERALFGYSNQAIVGQTAADVRDKMITSGKSSIIELYKHTKFCPEFIASRRRVEWPNGAFALTYAGDDVDQVRGVSGSTGWADEVAKYQYPDDLVSNLEFGIRETTKPFTLITTTPKPIPAIKSLFEDPSYYNITGSTLENIATPEKFRQKILSSDLTTVTARQEVFGEILWEDDGALWRRAYIDDNRRPAPEEFYNLIIALDPTSGVGGKRNDETGIVIAGSVKHDDGEVHAYILEDRTMKGSPKEWAQAVVKCLEDYPLASVLAESNAGGTMVEEMLTKYGVPRSKIQLKHHIKSKYDRAQPVSAEAQKGYIHHCDVFKELEDELCSYTGMGREKSPNRLDALVIACHALLIKRKIAWGVGSMGI